MIELSLQVGLCALGFIAHVLKSADQTAAKLTLKEYLSKYPRPTAVAGISAVGALFAFYEMGQLNYTTAFAAGYVANSLADRVTGRAQKVLR